MQSYKMQCLQAIYCIMADNFVCLDFLKIFSACFKMYIKYIKYSAFSSMCCFFTQKFNYCVKILKITSIFFLHH